LRLEPQDLSNFRVAFLNQAGDQMRKLPDSIRPFIPTILLIYAGAVPIFYFDVIMYYIGGFFAIAFWVIIAIILLVIIKRLGDRLPVSFSDSRIKNFFIGMIVIAPMYFSADFIKSQIIKNLIFPEQERKLLSEIKSEYEKHLKFPEDSTWNPVVTNTKYFLMQSRPGESVIVHQIVNKSGCFGLRSTQEFSGFFSGGQIIKNYMLSKKQDNTWVEVPNLC
jgi:hypothetical protein